MANKIKRAIQNSINIKKVNKKTKIIKKIAKFLFKKIAFIFVNSE